MSNEQLFIQKFICGATWHKLQAPSRCILHGVSFNIVLPLNVIISTQCSMPPELLGSPRCQLAEIISEAPSMHLFCLGWKEEELPAVNQWNLPLHRAPPSQNLKNPFLVRHSPVWGEFMQKIEWTSKYNV